MSVSGIIAATLIVLFSVLSGAHPAYSSDNYLGEKECFACHKDIKRIYVNTRHGKTFSVSSGDNLASRGCEACHGPGTEHKAAVDRDDKELFILSFKNKSAAPADKNTACLACHEKENQNLWRGSTHEVSGVNCADCHTIHTEGATVTLEACFKCHKERRAQLQRSSHMPLREGKMTCANCHNPHGGFGPSLLKTSSINENCYECHAEKRGPMLWEHPPVRERCTNCHEPHGSNYENLLKFRVPYLCQNCHDVAFHPSTLYDGSRLPGANPAQQLLGKGCLNCHSLIHGSNHPSGARFQR